MPDGTPLSAVLKLLADDRRALREAVERVPAYAREMRPSDDQWSVAEILEHIAIIEGRITMVMTGFLATAPMRESNAAPLEPTASLRSTLLDRERKIKAPAPSHPTGEFDATVAMNMVEQARVHLLDALRDAGGRDLSAVSRQHPVLGPLNGYQWLESLAGHEARHTAQILDIANENEQELS